MTRNHSNRFKFDAQSFFLTYARCTLEQQAVIDHLNSVKEVTWLRIATEQHEDGTPHIHVVGQFVARFQSTNSRIFDVGGFHPDIQSVRSIPRALAYVAKGGEFRDIGPVPQRELAEEVDWIAVAGTMDRGEYYLRCFRAGLPARYAEIFWECARGLRTEVPIDYEWDEAWEHEQLRAMQPSQLANVVIGPAGAGKTSWAKRVCAKPALWVRHLDVLRSFRPGYHQAIIFDDMSFMHLPRETQIHLVDTQDESHIHVRYAVARIPAGTPRFFTANQDIFLDDPAINRRINLIRL